MVSMSLLAISTNFALDALLCLFQLFLIKQIWILHQHSKNERNSPSSQSNNSTPRGKDASKFEPTNAMIRLKWIESTFESIPQAILQTVFFIRSLDYNQSDGLKISTGETIFLTFSLFWSIVSVIQKFVENDRNEVRFEKTIHKSHFQFKVKSID